ncbi:hypothetical protein AB0D04_17905 [Streptomyces sp. NPDC048483]|uniref:hypothetical protein n=1 Tax=Streptomyces sp. NPDC048483 TaxID=3154927 RepID=UPI00343D718E
MAGAAGVGVFMLLAVGCGGAATPGKASPGPSEAVRPAKPLPLKSAPRQASWTDSDDAVHQLRLTPTRLARGADSDLRHVQLDDDLKGQVPYYLTFSYTNTGKGTVDRPDPARNFSVNGADGQAAQQVSLFQSNPMATSSGVPPECRGGSKDTLAPGDSTADCVIFMLPKGAQPATVSYKDDDSGTLLWQVGGAKGGASGGVLPVGKPADGVTADSSRRSVALRITPKGVRTGSLADLSRFDLDADKKKLVPYYVTMQYRNTGSHDLLPSMNNGVMLRSAGGQEAKKLILIDIGGPGVSQCPESVPHEMVKPGATVTECSTHLMEKGDPPVAVVFQGEGEGRSVTWRAKPEGGE